MSAWGRHALLIMGSTFTPEPRRPDTLSQAGRTADPDTTPAPLQSWLDPCMYPHPEFLQKLGHHLSIFTLTIHSQKKIGMFYGDPLRKALWLAEL